MAISTVFKAAFGRTTEVHVVDTTRASCPDTVFLGALQRERVVGPSLSAQQLLQVAAQPFKGWAVAQRPSHQIANVVNRIVIGTSWNRGTAERGSPYITVLCHPEHCGRLGLAPALWCGIRSSWHRIHEGAYKLLVLDEQAMAGALGTVSYRQVLEEAR